MHRITKRQAIKRFNAGLPFILCPCKMMPGFPWDLGCRVNRADIESYQEHATWYAPSIEQPNGGICWKGTLEATAWSLLYNEWAFYNTSYETGYYAHYYV